MILSLTMILSTLVFSTIPSTFSSILSPSPPKTSSTPAETTAMRRKVKTRKFIPDCDCKVRMTLRSTDLYYSWNA